MAKRIRAQARAWVATRTQAEREAPTSVGAQAWKWVNEKWRRESADERRVSFARRAYRAAKVAYKRGRRA